jgi:multicomponent Na+:H+ antiporter subunit B
MNPQALMLQVAARPLYVLILLASLWVLLRGHNEPGGGFIAALLATSGSVLWAAAHGPQAAARRLPWRSPLALGVAGALIAGLSGLPAWAFGLPYLTHLWGSLELGFTQIKLSTVLVFDLGVYLCVWGALAGYALALIGLDDAGPEDRSAHDTAATQETLR